MPTPNHLRTIDSVLLRLQTKTFNLTLVLKEIELSAEGMPYIRRPEPALTHLEQFDDQLKGLRESFLGSHLMTIAKFAEGEADITKEAVQDAIKVLYEALFDYPFADDLTPPASFHKTELGRMIGEAYLRLTAGAELLTPTEAYQEMQVSRQAIYNFVRENKLHPLYIYGKMMLFAHEIAALKTQREEAMKKALLEAAHNRGRK